MIRIALAFLGIAGICANRSPAADPITVAAAIDREIDQRLAEAKIPASPLADDAEFLRRVSLDIAGRLPTVERASAFLDDKDADKRRKLIDSLLANPAFGQHFGTLWRNRLAPPGSPVKGKAPPDRFSPWLAEQFNRNVSWDKLVSTMLTFEGDIAKAPESGFLMANSEGFKPRANLLAASASRLFLGVRLGCAECHDHPFANWKQSDFWGTAAFFGRLRNTGKKGPPFILTEDPDPQPLSMKDDPAQINAAPGGSIIIPGTAGKAAGQTIKAAFLGGPEQKLDDEKPFRPTFAAWVTARDNPYFAKAFVNRTWAQLFGRGFVNPVDDLREGNAPSHPALLELLAEEFRASGHDVKHLIRCLCNSKAYQRTSRPLVGNEKDVAHFSHMTVKPIGPEAFYDSLVVLNAIDKNVPLKKGVKSDPRDDFVLFFRAQGDGEEDGLMRHGIPQFLKRLNGETFNRGGPLIERLMRSGVKRDKMVESLFLATLTRRPTSEEVELMVKYLDGRPDAEKGYAGVLWILLNTGEFVLNH
jgi:hypothetical protein